MSNTYIHIDDVETLSEYDAKLGDWKHKLYELFDEIRIYHESLEADRRWYGRSHEEFYEQHIKFAYEKFLQPAAQHIDEESRPQLKQLRLRAEELSS